MDLHIIKCTNNLEVYKYCSFLKSILLIKIFTKNGVFLHIWFQVLNCKWSVVSFSELSDVAEMAIKHIASSTVWSPHTFWNCSVEQLRSSPSSSLSFFFLPLPPPLCHIMSLIWLVFTMPGQPRYISQDCLRWDNSLGYTVERIKIPN